MDSAGKRLETTTGLRIRRFIEVLTDSEDCGFLLLLVDFELPSLVASDYINTNQQVQWIFSHFEASLPVYEDI